MSYRFVFYENKHKDKLNKYLKKIEPSFKYIPFLFSLDSLLVLSQYKKVFLILKNNKVVNVGYLNICKNHARFLFELPKIDYDFLKNVHSIAVSFLNNNFNYNDYVFLNENIIDIKKLLKLEENSFRNIRKKIKQFKKLYPKIEITAFDCRKHLENDFFIFFNRWVQNYIKKGKTPCLFLDKEYLKHIYGNGMKTNCFRGLIAKEENKIVGFIFYIISPGHNQAINLAQKTFYKYKGLNEFLLYEASRILWEEDDIRYINIGPSRDEGVLNFKRKFNTEIIPSFTIVLKGFGKEDKSFWYADHFNK